MYIFPSLIYSAQSKDRSGRNISCFYQTIKTAISEANVRNVHSRMVNFLRNSVDKTEFVISTKLPFQLFYKACVCFLIQIDQSESLVCFSINLPACPKDWYRIELINYGTWQTALRRPMTDSV